MNIGHLDIAEMMHENVESEVGLLLGVLVYHHRHDAGLQHRSRELSQLVSNKDGWPLIFPIGQGPCDGAIGSASIVDGHCIRTRFKCSTQSSLRQIVVVSALDDLDRKMAASMLLKKGDKTTDAGLVRLEREMIAQNKEM